MTQSIDKQTRETKDAIDQAKISKYIERFIEGKLDNPENSLPNMLSTGNFNREKYDYRIGQFKTKSHSSYNSHIILVLQKFERAKMDKEAMVAKLEQDKQEIIKALVLLKDAVNSCYESNGKSPYL